MNFLIKMKAMNGLLSCTIYAISSDGLRARFLPTLRLVFRVHRVSMQLPNNFGGADLIREGGVMVYSKTGKKSIDPNAAVPRVNLLY